MQRSIKPIPIAASEDNRKVTSIGIHLQPV